MSLPFAPLLFVSLSLASPDAVRDLLPVATGRDLVLRRDTTHGPPTLLRHMDAGPFVGAPADVAVAFLASFGPRLGWLPEGTRWQVVHDLEWRGRHRVHLQQLHLGLPVLGGHGVVKVDAEGRVGFASLHLVRLSPDLPLVPQVDPVAAVRLALAAVDGRPRLAPRARLAILYQGGRGRLVYEMLVYTDAPRGAWRVRVDASSGEVLPVQDLRIPAQAWVYPHNPANSELSEVTLQGLPEGAETLDGSLVAAWNTVRVGSDYSVELAEQYAVADESGDFWYEPQEGSFEDPFVEVQTYYQLTSLASYFAETHGHSFVGQTQVYGNFTTSSGVAYDNAFFMNDETGAFLIHLGQGTVDLGYDADVMDHEFGHGIINDLTDVNSYISYPFGFDEYGFAIAPHAMNEGMADYWSSSFNGDPLVGEYFGQAFGWDALRDLENDFTCPEDVYGEPHDDGQLIGGTTWEIRQSIGDAVVADTLLYGALGYVSPTLSFREFADATLEAGQDLVDDGLLGDAQLDAIEGILEDRGLIRCGRAIDMTSGVPENGTWLGVDMLADYLGLGDLGEWACSLARMTGVVFPFPFQYAITTPAADEGGQVSLTLSLALEDAGGGEIGADDLSYDIYLREGELVTFSTADYYGYTLVSGAVDYDLAVSGEPSVVEISTGDDDLSLQPDTTYYLAIAGLNCPVTTFALTAELAATDDPADTGAPDGDTAVPVDSGSPSDTGGAHDTGSGGQVGDTGEAKDDAGCGCQVAPTRPLVLLWLAGLAGLVFLRRESHR